MLQWYFWKNKLKPNLSAVWTVKICINKRCFLMSLSYSVQILEAELRITFNMSMSPTHTAYIWFFSPVSADDFTAMTVLYFRKYPTQWTNKKCKSSVPVLQIFQTTCCWIEERMKPGRTCTNHPFPLSSEDIFPHSWLSEKSFMTHPCYSSTSQKNCYSAHHGNPWMIPPELLQRRCSQCAEVEIIKTSSTVQHGHHPPYSIVATQHVPFVCYFTWSLQSFIQPHSIELCDI